MQRSMKHISQYCGGLILSAALGFVSAQAQTITAVMYSPLRSLDPTISTAYIMRDYGYMVYDTLVALDANNVVQPQMASWTVSPDGKTYTFTLRDGLKWHDETPVTAADCVASIGRWSKVDPMGQVMASLMTDIKVINDKQFAMTFRVATDIALRALSKPSTVAAFMMPKAVAETPVTQPITSTIGSGPFKFDAAAFKPGVQAVFDKFKDYVPRKEPASGLAGGKVVKVDQVKWISMPDAMTAVNALTTGEIDYMEEVPPDMLPLLENDANVVVGNNPMLIAQNIARLNFIQPPFNNLKIRQAALLAVGQKAVLEAQMGNPKYFQVCAAVYGCNTPYSSDYGADKLLEPHPKEAAALLKEAGYKNEPVVLLQASDVAKLAPVPVVLAQQLRAAGFNVQMQSMDWQTVTSRRASRAAPEKGGWNIFTTTNTIPDVSNPISFMATAANGDKAWFGWPDVPQIESDRAKMAMTSDPAQLKALATDLQHQVIDQVVTIPLGELKVVKAWRKNVSEQVVAPSPVFWDMTKTGN